MALGLDDVTVGTWTSPAGVSGCTVVLPPGGSVGAVAVRGAAPGTREAAALGPSGKVGVCHAVVLSGGSAYGLSTADAVMGWLEERGTGYPVGRPGAGAVVPIVGAAIVLDGAVMDATQRPGPDAGRAACEAAVTDEPPEGGVGVGAGCTVAKVAGLEGCWASGQGVAVRRAGGVTVGALVANNAVGEVVADDGTWVARARVADDAPRYPVDGALLFGAPDGSGDHADPADAEHTAGAEASDADPADAEHTAGAEASDADPADAEHTAAADLPGPAANTVIGCVVTDARLDKPGAHRVADLAHSGIARALRPAHTEMDGDALFCLATGRIEASVDLVAHLAAEAVAEAARRGPLAATGRHGLPGLADR